jgi:micrococcal nuclease
MNTNLQAILWFIAGVIVSAVIILVARQNPASDAAPAPVRVEAMSRSSGGDGALGSVSAHVTRVIDGDTFEAAANIWLGQSVDVRVRMEGIDAPELHARCASELQRANLAKDALDKRIGGADVWLSRVKYDKYGGRVRASVSDDQGSVNQMMLDKGYAREYHGERRKSWCN